ncbi:hypothetical protein C1I72_03725 [Ehrlichia canis]|nr:hypothetical protein C1I72_03725 [Ehrlichia canis]
MQQKNTNLSDITSKLQTTLTHNSETGKNQIHKRKQHTKLNITHYPSFYNIVSIESLLQDIILI